MNPPPDDLVQQAYVRALERRPEAMDEPRGWLRRVVQRLAGDLRRGARRRREREELAAPAALTRSSVGLLAGEEVRRELLAAVDALPPACAR